MQAGRSAVPLLDIRPKTCQETVECVSMNAAETDDETLRERTVCALCRRRAVEGAVFEMTASEAGRYAICPECRYTGGQQQASGFLIPVMIVGVLFLLGTAFDSRSNGGRVFANLFVGWFIMLLTTLPH